MQIEEVKKRLQNKINELLEHEWQAKEARDYTACLQLYGAIIHFKKFLHSIEGE